MTFVHMFGLLPMLCSVHINFTQCSDITFNRQHVASSITGEYIKFYFGQRFRLRNHV